MALFIGVGVGIVESIGSARGSEIERLVLDDGDGSVGGTGTLRRERQDIFSQRRIVPSAAVTPCSRCKRLRIAL